MVEVCFKPCYKWNTFNTLADFDSQTKRELGFKPCYKWNTFNTIGHTSTSEIISSFKPCYKWNTFNTNPIASSNLFKLHTCFKPCYKWNTFNTIRNELHEIMDRKF